MNYSVEILLEQKTLLEEEMRFAEGKELEETKQKYVDVCTALNKLNLPDVMASAFDCLKNIANPISYMQEQAEKDGCKLNGQMAISLSEDANYLKGLANNFLARHLP